MSEANTGPQSQREHSKGAAGWKCRSALFRVFSAGTFSSGFCDPRSRDLRDVCFRFSMLSFCYCFLLLHTQPALSTSQPCSVKWIGIPLTFLQSYIARGHCSCGCRLARFFCCLFIAAEVQSYEKLWLLILHFERQLQTVVLGAEHSSMTADFMSINCLYISDVAIRRASEQLGNVFYVKLGELGNVYLATHQTAQTAATRAATKKRRRRVFSRALFGFSDLGSF